MKKALIFAGTTEGRIISQTLAKNGVFCDVHVATEYGEQVLNETDLLKVHVGRLGPEEIKALCDSEEYDVLIDATHPFATVVSENIRQNAGAIPLFRFERKIEKTNSEDARFFETTEECIAALEDTTGKIFLTTGSKDLHLYCKNEQLKKRLVVRVLPGLESLKLCYDAGLEGKQIIAMQGPFSVDMNRLQLKENGISVLVTKESGKTGGVDEKLQACELEKVTPYIIRNPSVIRNKSAINDYKELYQELENIIGIHIESNCCLEIKLAGIGPGNAEFMTEAVKNSIYNADYIFGAQRMLNSIHTSAESYPFYLAKDIIPVIKKIQNENSGDVRIVILFSGDTGFYSGQSKLRKELEKLENANISILPGLSSIQMLSAKTGIDWQDAKIISMHGIGEDIWQPELKKQLFESQKIFLLTSGAEDVRFIGKYIESLGVEEKYEIYVGYNLSYADENVSKLNSKQCCEVQKQGLYSIMLVPLM